MKHKELHTIATLCATMALLVVAAVFISTGINNSNLSPFLSLGVDSGSQTAGGWWCDNFNSDPFGSGCDSALQAPPIQVFTGSSPAAGGNSTISWGTGFYNGLGSDFATCTLYIYNGGLPGSISAAGAPTRVIPIGPESQATQTPQGAVHWFNGSFPAGPINGPTGFVLDCTEHFQTGARERSAAITVSPTGPAAPTNTPPRGYLDVVTGGVGSASAQGWAQDTDTPDQAIDVHFYINGPAGEGGTFGGAMSAAQNRGDLCSAIGSCNHGFNWSVPPNFCDGASHSVYAYGIDSAGGTNVLLPGSPKSFSCTPPANVISISANPPSVAYNGKSTITVSASGGSGYDACLLAGGQWGAGTPVGTSGGALTNALTTSTTYSYTCHDTVAGWQPWQSTTVSVGAQPAPPPAPPSVTTSCASGVLSGGACTISWTCPAGTTASFGTFPTGGAPSGSADVNPTSDTNYTVTCQTPSGNSSAGVTVKIQPPSLTITANPSMVRKGNATTVTWTASNVLPNSCSVLQTGGSTVGSGLSGSIHPTITQKSEYTLSCNTPAGGVSQSVQVSLDPNYIEN